MKSSSRDTPHCSRKGKAFIEAAKRVLDNKHEGEATVAMIAADADGDAFWCLFNSLHGNWFMSRSDKALALCFMAAICETGDA